MRSGTRPDRQELRRRFVANTRMVGESATGNPPYTQQFAVVQQVRDGLIVEADYYVDRAQALEAVDLSE